MGLLKVRVREQGTGSLMPVGLHTARVVSVALTDSQAGTPQVEFQLVNQDGQVRNAWFNLKGFKRNGKGFFVDSRNHKISLEGLEGEALIKAMQKRVEDPEVTEKLMEILGKFMGHLGFDIDEDVDIEDAVGKTCIVAVGKDAVGEKIVYTFALDNVDAAERITSKRFGFDVILDESPTEALV
jgi:hypothetical protein